MGQPGTSTTTLVITGALIGGALGGAYSPWMAMYSENAEDIDPRLQGMAWGLFNFMVRIVAVAVVILAPMVVEHTGSWRNWIIASGGCVVFFLIAMAFFVKGPWTTRQRLAEAAHSQAAVATH
jgi:OPA family glycerol-3-phosphate transporter-like MFS transporter